MRSGNTDHGPRRSGHAACSARDQPPSQSFPGPQLARCAHAHPGVGRGRALALFYEHTPAGAFSAVSEPGSQDQTAARRPVSRHTVAATLPCLERLSTLFGCVVFLQDGLLRRPVDPAPVSPACLAKRARPALAGRDRPRGRRNALSPVRRTGLCVVEAASLRDVYGARVPRGAAGAPAPALTCPALLSSCDSVQTIYGGPGSVAAPTTHCKYCKPLLARPIECLRHGAHGQYFLSHPAIFPIAGCP
jgi:hypothetical protein